ncbi:hypothetical protein O0I10_012871 [Lichtheimia ornata]|uniref:Uncharacterized protein n=1 Tax=Lichtheimia ornata TaxID=688661 RepID=A0AAD7XSQ0_9FUNG|nr:uncharacterized protein O0I10_012871 [Lichtheimia ornata]KAJ8651563.1 hypothetical protein O0I10_012871 [Lichtheimia ornata]
MASPVAIPHHQIMSSLQNRTNQIPVVESSAEIHHAPVRKRGRVDDIAELDDRRAGSGVTRDTELSETLREYYKRMSKDPDMTWDKTKSIRDGRNARIVNNMIAYIRGLEQHLNNNTSGDTGENPRRMHWTDHQIFAKAQNQLEYHKATADLTDELRKKHSAKVAKRNARKKKHDIRKEAFALGGRNLSTYREKGEDLLVAALMSDSDDDVNEDGQTVGRKLLRPHWRSDAANAFLDDLTTLSRHTAKGREYCQKRDRQERRTCTVVVQGVDDIVSKEVPDWAKVVVPDDAENDG